MLSKLEAQKFQSSSKIDGKTRRIKNGHDSVPFNFEKFKDEYASGLLKVIKAKAAGKKGKVRKLHVVSNKTDDLMEQLKAKVS